jgi:pimeloyl-ACP methyl ester carboxylesterase
VARAIEREEAPRKSTLLSAPAAYYYDLHRRDHVGAAQALAIPALVVAGGKDYQVPGEDFEIWKRRLETKPAVRFHLCERCTHLMIETDAEPGPENYKVDGHVSEELIRVLASWAKRK